MLELWWRMTDQRKDKAEPHWRESVLQMSKGGRASEAWWQDVVRGIWFQSERFSEV